MSPKTDKGGLRMIIVDIVREATSTDLNRMSMTSRKAASKKGEKENRETGAHVHVSPPQRSCVNNTKE